MRLRLCIIAAIIILGTAPEALSQEPTPTGETTIDTVVATVNGKAITRKQIENRLEAARSNPQFSGSQFTFEQALQVAINRQVLLQEAARSLSEGMLKRIRFAAKARVDDAKDPMEVENNPVDDDDLVDALYKNYLIMTYLDKKIDNPNRITPAQVREFYEKNQDLFTTQGNVTVRQILIREGGRSSEDAQAIAESAVTRLNEGNGFAAVAQELSEGPYRSAGGLWPPQKRGHLIDQVDKKAFSLDVGATSAPFHTPLGWHIVKVEKRSRASVVPFAEAQEKISSMLIQGMREEARKKLLIGLRSKAIITIVGQ